MLCCCGKYLCPLSSQQDISIKSMVGQPYILYVLMQIATFALYQKHSCGSTSFSRDHFVAARFGISHFVSGPFWSRPFWGEFHENNFSYPFFNLKKFFIFFQFFFFSFAFSNFFFFNL